MGRVTVDVKVLNLDDIRRAERDEIPADQIRSAVIPSLVDTGATFFCLPQSVIDQLGLPFNRVRQTRTITGPIEAKVFGGARLELQDRACDVEVVALPQETQALLGQLPLEAMDFWVDPTNQRLIGNPEHGGQWMAEVF